MAKLSDDFNRGDSADIGAAYSTLADNLQIVSGVLRMGGDPSVWASAVEQIASPTIGADQFISVRIASSTGAAGVATVELFLRLTDIENQYSIVFFPDDDEVEISETVDDVDNFLSGGPVAHGPGDRVSAFAAGSVITGFVNGVAVVTATDSTFATGQLAFGLFIETGVQADIEIDDLVAGDLATFVTGTAKGTTAAPGREGNGDLTVSFPGGYTPTAGDLALIILYNDDGGGSVPQNYAQVSGSPWGGGTPKLQAFYKILAGGESAPVTTISGSGTNISHCANMAIYKGVKASAPIDTVGTPSNGTGSPMTAGGITPSSHGCRILGLCGRGDNESASGQTLNASATDVVEQLDGGTGANLDSQVSMYDWPQAAAAASGNGSATTSITDPWVSVLIALASDIEFLIGHGGLLANIRNRLVREAA
jgi:hypothetical protein